MSRILIIRFSSIGDIIQCMGVVDGLRNQFTDARIEWITRSDMASIVEMDGRIDRVWRFNRKGGFRELVKTAWALRNEQFDYIYDAHNNLRSKVLKAVILIFNTAAPRWVTRGKSRFNRLLLFKFRLNRYKRWPFIGVESFREPLERWGIDNFSPTKREWHFSQDTINKFEHSVTDRTITLTPSANWPMKRWPIGHWQRLVELLPEHNFIILAGPDDTFCSEIEAIAPKRVVNLAGRSSLAESCYLVSRSNLVISGDTGLLHAADIFDIKSIALIGPTAFGYPMANHTSTVMELDMRCRPCTKDGRGKCQQGIYQQCLIDITPEKVAKKIGELHPIK